MSEQKNWFLELTETFFRVTIDYLKAQLLFFGINFALFTAFLWWFGLPLPALIAFGVALLDLVPIVGSGLVFIPWGIVCFITSNTELGWRLAALYIGMVVLRQFLEPIIVGRKIGLHPLLTLAASITGMLVFSLPGLIFGPIVVATLLKIYRLRLGNKS